MDTGAPDATREKGTRSKNEKSAINQTPLKHKRKPKKKEYAIEWRMKEDCKMNERIFAGWKEWKVYKRYATPKQRDMALKDLQEKESRFWEYRIV